jgi:TolB-like protein/Flp pilus assembly protein TadD
VDWRFLRELVRRRVPSVVGLYLAGGWGLLEFTGWAAGRFNLSNNLEIGLVAMWGLLLPAVTAAAWKWGGPALSLTHGVTPQLEPSPHPGPSTLPGPWHPSHLPGVTESRSVAVLPFLNMSGDPGDDYLGDGLSEEILNALVKVPDLRVASRTSAFAYRGTSKDVRAIGRELNVSSILEGSVQRSHNRIRVTTQLVSAADGYHLWSERFDGEMEDVFAIEDRIAEKVARALRVILNGQAWERAPRIQPSDIRAYEYYLRGHQFLLNPRVKSLGYAREMFEQAIEVDPGYAPAWAGIAEAAALLHMYYPSRTDALEEADRASREALRIAPTFAEAHAARGLTLFLMQKLEEAEEAFQEARRLDPRLFQARYFHGRACFQSGRMDEAAAEFKEAARIREDYQAAFFAAQTLEALGRGQEAREQLVEALRVVEKHMELNPDDPRAATIRAVSLCRLGRPEEGLLWAEKALEIDPEDAGVRYNAACLYSLEGKVEEAIRCLEEAFNRGFRNKEWFEKDPDLNPLRADARFQSLIQQI